MIRTLACALGAALLWSGAAFAADRPILRGDVVAKRDILTLADLVEGAPAALAETALFRSPVLGQTGTIQTRRIVEAAQELGMSGLETGGRLQITVTRAARQVGGGEIEAALRRALGDKLGFDPAATGIVFDGAPPQLTLAPDTRGEVVAGDLLLDRRSRRLSATVWIGPSPTERRASLRVSGTVVDLVDVAVLTRSLERGESVRPSDISVEKRPRDAVSPDAILDGTSLAGRVARRALGAGGFVRSGDLARPELVQKGEIVTAVYEAPGMILSMRVRASEGGALGDVITIVNPGSKKAVPATVVAPGKVSVRPGFTERVVAAGALPSQN
ncbi:flagellar basal body P-ring formation chaperone FlgA [Enterovirga aerilata]|uniref:Flagellar basal body P-ring formation protein FlgA n=1 Tax=Enterovirga aerilata TaxID=2730920 RepID=A0A849HX00_9HYPH|nr:flagellar basal body P-ring formation chaperone FlgA [Enterovirga sp. DB1703]NNM71632.1 flagellar basal body P-ring formation protein FlgA [Enterovirga sp. DB1703]